MITLQPDFRDTAVCCSEHGLMLAWPGIYRRKNEALQLPIIHPHGTVIPAL